MILFMFPLTANQNQDTSELKAPEVVESFRHSHLILEAFGFF